MLRLLSLIALTVIACSTPPDGSAFEHLRRTPEGLESTHGLRYAVSAAGMRVVGPTHRTDTFSGHPYEISLGALIAEREAVLVHAERVADASGASNYENLPLASWPAGGEFRWRRICAHLEPQDIVGEHDLEWLRENGFDPVGGGLALAQFYASSGDHNDEVVVTLAVRNVDCDDQPAVEAAVRSLQERVQVRRL